MAAIVAAWSLTPAHGAIHHRRHARHAPSQSGQPNGASAGTTCRTADGTPYDPDIIGGANHVGDGGPAVNFGNSRVDPCDPVNLGGPGLLGPR